MSDPELLPCPLCHGEMVEWRHQRTAATDWVPMWRHHDRMAGLCCLYPIRIFSDDIPSWNRRAEPEQEGASEALPEAAQQPTPPSNSDLVKALERMTDHFATWVRDHADEATAETDAILYCARSALRAHRGEKE